MFVSGGDILAGREKAEKTNSDVDVGNVTNDILIVVDHGKRGDALFIHYLQCIRERSVAAVHDCQ